MPANIPQPDQNLSELDKEFMRATCPVRTTELLQQGANINAKCSNGYTKMHQAIEKKQYGILAILIAGGAKIMERESKQNKTSLAMALGAKDLEATLQILTSDSKELVEYAVRHGMDMAINQVYNLANELSPYQGALASFYTQPIKTLTITKKILEKEVPEIGKFFPMLPCNPAATSMTREQLHLFHIFIKANILIKFLDPNHLKAIETLEPNSKQISNHIQISPLLINIFKNTGSQFRNLSKRLLDVSTSSMRHVPDFINFSSDNLLGVEILNQIPTELLRNYERHRFNAIMSKIQNSWASYLTANRDLVILAKLSETWHNNVDEFENLARDFPRSGASWPGIIPNKEILLPADEFQGFKLVELTKSIALKKEGQDLQHCVGSYASRCIQGVSHIFSVRDSYNVAQSTFEVSIVTSDKVLSHPPSHNATLIPKQSENETQRIMLIKQHFGTKNDPPSKICSAALTWFCKQVAEGKFDLKPNVLKTVGATGENWVISPIEEEVGIRKVDLTSERKEQIIKFFTGRNDNHLKLRIDRKKSLLPRAYSNKSYDDFFEESGLRAAIKNAIESVNLS